MNENNCAKPVSEWRASRAEELAQEEGLRLALAVPAAQMGKRARAENLQHQRQQRYLAGPGRGRCVVGNFSADIRVSGSGAGADQIFPRESYLPACL